MIAILLRHGQSVWNLEGRFTGWTDVGLTDRGIQEAKEAGKLLKDFDIKIVYTSVLKRAIKTSWIVLEEMDKMYLPVIKDWRLNERHYGDLQGKNKKQMVSELGKEIVFKWRRSFKTRPPALSPDDPRNPANDPRYIGINTPLTESLEDVYNRVVPYWENEIKPKIKELSCVLISAHGNSLRALVKYLDKLDDKEVESLNIPTGIPLVYEFDDEFHILNKHYLGNKDELEKRVNEVKNQIKV